jgi:hypothetical protein
MRCLANCGRAVAHVRGSYLPISTFAPVEAFLRTVPAMSKSVASSLALATFAQRLDTTFEARMKIRRSGSLATSGPVHQVF